MASIAFGQAVAQEQDDLGETIDSICTDKTVGVTSKDCVDKLNNAADAFGDFADKFKENIEIYGGRPTGRTNDNGCYEIHMPGSVLLNLPLVFDDTESQQEWEDALGESYKWVCPGDDDFVWPPNSSPGS